MKKVVALLFWLAGWACLVNVGLGILGKPTLFSVPPKYSIVVTAVACFVALGVAWRSVALLGRAGLIVSALPMFGLSAAAGYMAAGPAGGAVGFVVPFFIALKWGITGLACAVVLAVVIAVIL